MIADLATQLTWDRLIALAEEQAQALLRSAFSTTVREAGDLSAGIFDPRGRMLAQAVTGTPGHVNSMAESIRHFIAAHPIEAMRAGDHYISNDPWLTSGHLHDITVVTPAFHQGRCVALFACACHQVDIGGLGQGPDGRSIFEEGIRLPILRLARDGAFDPTLLAILRANVRRPFEVEGDIRSYCAANAASARALAAMLAQQGMADLEALGEEILTRSHRATLAAIAALPRGSWSSRLRLDGVAGRAIELACRVSIVADEVLVDFAGTSAAVPRGVNVVLPYTRAYAAFGVKTVVAPDVPNNAGSLAPIRVEAPAGSVLNAQDPAPVAARHVVGQFLPDAVFACLAQAMPQRVPAAGSSVLWTVQLRGGPEVVDAEGHQGRTSFETVFFNSGGTGARPGMDGLDGTAFPAGVKAVPIEVVEANAPIIVWRKELRPGSGGLGEFRGGHGQVVEVAALATDEPIAVLAMFERCDNPADGAAGGQAGAAGAVRLSSGATLAGKGLQTVPAGQRLVLELPGGGGWGNPAARQAGGAEADDGLD
ncbi:hydantoinase B/oxoprolinase family protein [Neoroseomonas lacus]|uniref:N-methylhydantoinase B n=1 Tax=Neoroseomonas lacus TaxID=287609 RepID=A0A917KPA0_9PROT|nr:hydantoinase B/oxoprolinase family protein [Neoroseomonas lacus]GGJ23562.1 N-methylhydantoinase B [Neoroseomonas lacus]